MEQSGKFRSAMLIRDDIRIEVMSNVPDLAGVTKS